METLPDKLNPVVKPLMESIKREECQIIQQLSANYLVKLLDLVRIRNPSPNNKIITNLCTLLKSDAEFTPKIVSKMRGYCSTAPNFVAFQIPTDKLIQLFNPHDYEGERSNPYHGVLTLYLQQKATYNQQHNGSLPRGPGRPPIQDINIDELSDTEDPVSYQRGI